MEKNHKTVQTGLPRYLWNAVHHFRTINRHKREVMKNCFRVGLYKQGLLHDLSKYSWTEFKTGVKYYQGYRSPNTAERLETGLCEAWLHHKGRNKHHFEYWVDYDTKKKATMVGCRMPYRYVAEMFCDRVAASKVYKGADYDDSCPYGTRGRKGLRRGSQGAFGGLPLSPRLD